MSTMYEIHSGRRVVSIQYSVSPLQAAVDYVRSFGGGDGEIIRLGRRLGLLAGRAVPRCARSC